MTMVVRSRMKSRKPLVDQRFALGIILAREFIQDGMLGYAGWPEPGPGVALAAGNLAPASPMGVS